MDTHFVEAQSVKWNFDSISIRFDVVYGMGTYHGLFIVDISG